MTYESWYGYHLLCNTFGLNDMKGDIPDGVEMHTKWLFGQILSLKGDRDRIVDFVLSKKLRWKHIVMMIDALVSAGIASRENKLYIGSFIRDYNYIDKTRPEFIDDTDEKWVEFVIESLCWKYQLGHPVYRNSTHIVRFDNWFSSIFTNIEDDGTLGGVPAIDYLKKIVEIKVPLNDHDIAEIQKSCFIDNLTDYFRYANMLICYAAVNGTFVRKNLRSMFKVQTEKEFDIGLGIDDLAYLIEHNKKKSEFVPPAFECAAYKDCVDYLNDRCSEEDILKYIKIVYPHAVLVGKNGEIMQTFEHTTRIKPSVFHYEVRKALELNPGSIIVLNDNYYRDPEFWDPYGDYFSNLNALTQRARSIYEKYGKEWGYIQLTPFNVI